MRYLFSFFLFLPLLLNSATWVGPNTNCKDKPLVRTSFTKVSNSNCYDFSSQMDIYNNGKWQCINDTTALKESYENKYSGTHAIYNDCGELWYGYYSVVASCPVGQILDSNNVCKLAECPVGTIKDASGKYCVPQTCPVGSTRDPNTLHCLPTKCPEGQTLISDGTCQTSCPPNSSRVDKICRYDCGHWSKDLCGKYLDSQGNKCVWSYGSFIKPVWTGSDLGYCTTEDGLIRDIESIPAVPLGAHPLPKLPEYQPMPIKPYEPVKPDIPKPANDPAYVPPVTPKPVEPIPAIPLPTTKPANDPDYVPTIEPVTPLTPDIAPYAPPSPEPAPAPLPAPVPLPAPAPAPSPTPSPLPSPEPEEIPDPLPLPMPKPDYTFDPVPEPEPVIDPVTGEPVPAPAPSSVPDVNMPNVNMPSIPDVLDFSVDDMDKFRYNATTMSYNILDQVDNVQNTFTNTMNILNNGFPPVVLPSGSCGSSMSFGFYGKEIDLCPPLANTSAQFAPLFQLLIFLVGLIASIKIFMIGLRD
ncbi:MAG: hypothetical protein Q8N01_06040 [Sulfuricurvum sp.]|nr:hypothetical protein [Sulfuricurvum sp.]